MSEHREAFAEDNAWHDSELLVVPVMEMRTFKASDGHLEHVVAASTVEIGLEQHATGEELVHVGINGERARTVYLSVESVERLLQEVLSLLKTVRHKNDGRRGW